MKLVLKLKLQTDASTHALLLQTTEQYRQACRHLSKIAFETRTFGKFALQRLAYCPVKERYNLPSQLVIRALAQVCSTYKSVLSQIREHNRSCKPHERRVLERIEFAPNLAVPYDQRVMLLDRGGYRVSLRTLSCRIWLPFQVGERRQPLLAYAHGQADLKRLGKDWFLYQTIEVPEAERVETTNFIGVDAGICTLATATDGCQTLQFPGTRLRQVRRHHFQLRRGLQRHNTKSSRRRLRKLRDKESKKARTVNHVISRRVVEMAKRTNSTLVLEDLEGLRAGVKVTDPSLGN